MGAAWLWDVGIVCPSEGDERKLTSGTPGPSRAQAGRSPETWTVLEPWVLQLCTSPDIQDLSAHSQCTYKHPVHSVATVP